MNPSSASIDSVLFDQRDQLDGGQHLQQRVGLSSAQWQAFEAADMAVKQLEEKN